MKDLDYHVCNIVQSHSLMLLTKIYEQMTKNSKNDIILSKYNQELFKGVFLRAGFPQKW